MQLALQHKKQSTRFCSMNNFRKLGKAAGRAPPRNLFMEGLFYKFQYQTRQSFEVIRMSRRLRAHLPREKQLNQADEFVKAVFELAQSDWAMGVESFRHRRRGGSPPTACAATTSPDGPEAGPSERPRRRSPARAGFRNWRPSPEAHRKLPRA